MKLLPVDYLGCSAMDKRFSTPMLPWIITEIRRRRTNDKICVGVEDGTVQAYDKNFELQFTHKIENMLRFSRAVQDARSFMYLLRDQEKPVLYCHLFRAAREDDVTELFKQMREQGGLAGHQAAGGYGAIGTTPVATTSPTTPRRRMPPRSQSSAANLTSLCADISPSSSHFFEVLYIGKIKVSHKKVPDSFIDDALVKFQAHEDAKTKEKLEKDNNRKNEQYLGDKRRESQDSVTSDTGSTDSCSTKNLINQQPAATKQSTTKNTNQLVNINNNINNNNNNNNNLKTDTNSLYISDAELLSSPTEPNVMLSPSEHTNQTKLNDNDIPIIRTERSDSIVSDSDIPTTPGGHGTIELDKELEDRHRVQRTISESAINNNNTFNINNNPEFQDSLNRNNIYSKSFENVPSLSVSNLDNKNNNLRLNMPMTMSAHRFGSVEALPTVDEDNTTKIDENDNNSNTEVFIKKTDNNDHNRTMVFQVGRFDLRLISPDRKQILLHKQLKDVATCIQGLQNTAHFGFICREPNVETFMGYIFKCESDSVAVDVVQAIKQSFTSTTEHFKRPRPAIVSCEHCPMVWYHKLCAEIENQNDRKTQAIIFKRISFLEDDEQSTILAKFRGAEADSTREQNEFLMMLLRAHCEAKQTRHIHDTAENRSEFLNQYLGGSTIFMKAKRSLTNSFDHLLKRKGSRDDFGPQLREMNLNVSREASPAVQTLDVPGSDMSESANSPTRSRTSTISSINGDDRSPTGSIAGDVAGEKQLKSPMMDIFFKVGSSPKSPAKDAIIDNKSPQITSWRQEMLNKVKTPNKNENSEKEAPKKRTREELRELWKKAIRQALLLKRMEKENERLTARQEESAVKRIKLEYDEISPCQRDVVQVWEHIAKKDARIANKFDKNMLLQAIKQGVPRSKRGDVWHFLANQFCIKQPPFDTKQVPNYNTPYEDLLKQLTSHQHAILIDLGRTFPNHPYYSSPLGPGQLSLFNILKAYSLLDPEVGYCQGLSFVAGILLLHMPEAEAFFLLRHLMFRRGMRKLYLPDMEALQVNLYQLSRLLHDQISDLYEHFNQHDVTPALYAAPWILTIFASQFPLGFVARVFDMIFLENPDVVFRVIIALLNIHKENLLNCDCFEEIMDYLKNTLPVIDHKTMDDVMRSVFMTDISSLLTEYRVEYHVLQEEMASVRPQLDSLAKLEQQNKQLLEQNQRFMEQLEIAVSNTQRMEQTRAAHQATINRLESQIRSLEVTVNTLGNFVNNVIEKKIDIEIPGDVRRIVQQISLSERRNINNNLGNMKKLEPQKYMVKSLSMSRLGLNFNKNNNNPTTNGPEPLPRSQSVNIGNTVAVKAIAATAAAHNNNNNNTTGSSNTSRRNSILNAVNDNLNKMETKGHRGFPLRVIDDHTSYEPPPQTTAVKPAPKYPLKTAVSQPALGVTKSSSFFANSHNHIQQQRLNSLALKQGFKDVNSLIEKLTDTKRQQQAAQQITDSNKNNVNSVNIPIEKCVSLPLNVKDNFQSDYLQKCGAKSNLNSDMLSDSGISTPVSPTNSSDEQHIGMSEIPLFDSDVHCTFNGTKQLKTIKTGVKCVKP